jgi:hypothetical protein
MTEKQNWSNETTRLLYIILAIGLAIIAVLADSNFLWVLSIIAMIIAITINFQKSEKPVCDYDIIPVSDSNGIILVRAFIKPDMCDLKYPTVIVYDNNEYRYDRSTNDPQGTGVFYKKVSQ